MKFIRTGLTTGNLASLLHDTLYVKAEQSLLITGVDLNDKLPIEKQLNNPKFHFRSNQSLHLESKFDSISIVDSKNNLQKVSLVIIKPENSSEKVFISDNQRFLNERVYKGEIWIFAQKNKIRVILKCSLEEYVRSVLKAEMPASYHLEAIKAQALSARTYALHPRVNHQADLCDVCDSYLCCQAFSGWQASINPIYIQASSETSGEVLTYNDQPILALFSSCAGGHTENYEDCFSDWATGLFPPKPLPYLQGVNESTSKSLANENFNEIVLKRLWSDKNVSTFDSWSPQFRWSLNLSADELESTMHNTLAQLLEKKEFAPFITAPPSASFGSIQAFSIGSRGRGGTAIELGVSTSKGNWQLKKELTIRSLFRHRKTNLNRLPSAKIFFDQVRDNNQQLQSLVIHGLGHGHGVGMQQVGAQGMAERGNNYQQILRHYYSGVNIEVI